MEQKKKREKGRLAIVRKDTHPSYLVMSVHLLTLFISIDVVILASMNAASRCPHIEVCGRASNDSHSAPFLESSSPEEQAEGKNDKS